MNAIEIMTMTLKLLFSHLFWMRFFQKSIISNFIFEFIEHKIIKCDKNEKHFISLNLMWKKFQRTIFFVSRFRFNSFLQCWKTFIEFHNLIYFDFYHTLRCIEITIASSSIFNVILTTNLTAITIFFLKIEFFHWWKHSRNNSIFVNFVKLSNFWFFSNFRVFIFSWLHQFYFDFNNFCNVEMRLFYFIIDENYKTLCNVIVMK